MFPLHLVEKHCKKSCDGLSMMHLVLLYRDIKQEDFQDYYLKLWWQLEANNQWGGEINIRLTQAVVQLDVLI